MTYVYNLTAPQSKIAQCTKRFRVVNAGRRFGKTWLSGATMMQAATSKTATERGDYVIWYVAPTQSMARNLMWDTWIKKYLPREWIEKSNEQRMVLRLKNGASLYFLSADEPDHLRGSGVDLLVMDECSSMDEKVYDIIRPVLADKHHEGRGLYISTPSGFNWFYDLYCKAKEMPDQWEAFQYTTIDGGNVTDEEIEQNRREMSPKMFAQEYLASFENMANRVYDNYSRVDNCCTADDSWGLGDIHIGMDFNVNPMTAAISVIENDRELDKIVYFFDEIVEPNSNTQAICNIIKKRYPLATVYVYPDPTGNKKQTSAAIGVTDMQILRDNGFIVCAPRAPYPTKDKFNSVNAAFLNAKGEHRCYVDKDRCPKLVKALEGYSYKENGDTDKSTGLDHISDAMAYLLCYRLPFKKTGAIYKPKVYGV